MSLIDNLPDNQQQAIFLLLRSGSFQDVAKKVKFVHLTIEQIMEWMGQPEFLEAYREARITAQAELEEIMNLLAERTLNNISSSLGQKIKPTTRSIVQRINEVTLQADIFDLEEAILVRSVWVEKGNVKASKESGHTTIKISISRGKNNNSK